MSDKPQSTSTRVIEPDWLSWNDDTHKAICAHIMSKGRCAQYCRLDDKEAIDRERHQVGQFIKEQDLVCINYTRSNTLPSVEFVFKDDMLIMAMFRLGEKLHIISSKEPTR